MVHDKVHIYTDVLFHHQYSVHQTYKLIYDNLAQIQIRWKKAMNKRKELQDRGVRLADILERGIEQ